MLSLVFDPNASGFGRPATAACATWASATPVALKLAPDAGSVPSEPAAPGSKTWRVSAVSELAARSSNSTAASCAELAARASSSTAASFAELAEPASKATAASSAELAESASKATAASSAEPPAVSPPSVVPS